MLEALDELFSPGCVTRAADDLAHWGRDWTTAYKAAPSAVVFPKSIHEVVALVRWAGSHGVALVPSGGRTGLSGGAVANHGEVVVSFDRMNAISDFRPADRLVTCQAGVVTANLQGFATEQGLSYPVDFASSGSSQIGGNIATNAGGIKVIRYGLTRDWVAGLTVVSGSGEILECNQGLIKNATGYDLRHLFVGSEGTLGFIVEAQMRLALAPPPQRVMVLGVPRFADILEVLSAMQARLVLSAFEFFADQALAKVMAHRDLQSPLSARVAFYALIEFDDDALEEATAVFEHCVASGWVVDAVLSQSDTQAGQLWQLREAISESIAPFTPYKNDISVCIGDMPGFLDAVEMLVAREYPDFEVCWYGHIGDGNLHLNILKPESMDTQAFYARCHEISPKVFQAVAEKNGSISAEHGVGLLKRDFLGFSRSPAEIGVMRGLKGVLDPHGIMNPGKLL
ncbi:MAG: FAD-binding oxidoreductase [Pseudomonadales bacterium]|jgi:FAD/FMN-containing dehydrogenase|nr:FAD-binding oxidoreductase [Pseudomonadales bacterium]MDP6469481.1 FAD-binding oxidoreductase [Pseudomonadales bacterium]MDP6827323.1 FAD-binding oxidoreductase [Pseudomonadales bacterium]MDP6971146.1 FAD-binding oxidoreductase [Pseudomonadales bacterium]|tara:strand:+ start:2085 stop:3449 length:1365 start_codon:yes stop_codon:yes gene_type:complete